MRTSRIYYVGDLKNNAVIQLPEDRSHYVARVLRLKAGDSVQIFNGEGGEYAAVVEGLAKKTVTLKLKERKDVNRESPLKLHLGQAISRGEKMDWVIQKAVELGVTEFTPLFTERCDVKLSAERLQKRLEHWRGVVISACEQCGRNELPVVHDAKKLTDWATTVSADLKLVFAPQANALPSTQPQSIAMIIGPEGGLAENELKLAKQQGFEAVQLGPRVLRTETAPVVALSVLQDRWGDLSIVLSK